MGHQAGICISCCPKTHPCEWLPIKGLTGAPFLRLKCSNNAIFWGLAGHGEHESVPLCSVCLGTIFLLETSQLLCRSR